jgi:hypothetical protein
MTLKRLFISCFMLNSFIMSSECNLEEFSKNAAQKLAGYTYLKTYKLDASKEAEIEYSYVFSNNTQYVLTLAHELETTDILVSIYDNNRKELCNNYDKKGKKYFQGIGYSCSATGIYYVMFSFKNAKNKCGASVLGFKK